VAHRDAPALEQLWRELVSAGLDSESLLYHGDMQQFFRDLPFSPTLICTLASYISPSAIQGSVPPGVYVMVLDSGSQSSPDSLAACLMRGLLESVESAGSSRLFRTTLACTGHSAPISGEARTQLRSLLHKRYFGGSESAGVDIAAAARNIRKACIDHADPGASGYAPWPYRNPFLASLPKTLPSGAPWPKISIVTASFNQGRYIEQTILSVLNQGYPNVEHIIMDGGSSDETLEILARYRTRLAHVVSERDRGQSHAINKGMARATGDILTWLNSDDMLAPGALASVALAFDTSGADMVAGICQLYSGGRLIGQHLTACENGPLPLNDILDLDGGWNAGQFFYQPEVMFKRSLWLCAGGHVDETMFFSMDYDLWARFADAGARLHVIGRPVAWFRLHEEQKTHAQEKFFVELRRARDAFIARTGRTWAPRSVPKLPRQQLRIVLLNDHGFQFGAGIAHGRMAHALALAGHEIIPISLARECEDTEAVHQFTNDALVESVMSEKPDLIVVGNIHSVRPDPEVLFLLAERVPTLCMLHDFWLFTGRCGYPGDCAKYFTGCDETCPTAGEYPKLAPPAIAPAWRTKRLFLESGLPILLANSRWTAEYARKALLTLSPTAKAPRIETIQLSFPIDTFRPLDKQTCRRLLGLPEDQFILLLTCEFSDRRKGSDTLLAALQELQLPDLLLLSTSWAEPKPESIGALKIRKVGYVFDAQRLATIYCAADLVVGPSVEETFGQVFVEAAACGVPSVGFASSGIQEALRDNVTGRIAAGLDSSSLAAAILELYRNPDLRQDLSRWGRLYIENEWSPFSAYRQFFLALNRLGLREQLDLFNKIAFVPGTVQVAECRSLAAAKEIRGKGLCDVEGPLEQYNLPKFRWALGPLTSVEFEARQQGPHLLAIYYRNVHPDQEVAIEVNGSPAGTFRLPNTGMHAGRLLACNAELRRGNNTMNLRFAKWAPRHENQRPIALLITKIVWIAGARTAARAVGS
jgi:glycosyltransferase involved in cell wall biosynthesis